MKSLFLGFGCLTLLVAAGCGGDDDSVFSSNGGSANAGKGGSLTAGSTSSGGSAGKGSRAGGKGGSAGQGSGGSSGKGGSPVGGSAGCADDCCGNDCGSGGTTGGTTSGSGGTTGGSDSGGAGTGGSSGGSGAAGAGDAGAGGAMVGAPPTATINHPGDGEVRDAGDDIPFVGVGTDPEDGTLSGSALVWTSSLTGQFGTGELFDATLTAGTHVVTLIVTDADGNLGTDSVTLEIQ